MYGWAIRGASFGPQIIRALLWKRASGRGCLAGMLTGFTVALVWRHLYALLDIETEIYNLPLAFAAALVVNILVSLRFASGTLKDRVP